MNDEDNARPVTCRLSEEHGLGKKRLVQIAMDFGQRLQIKYTPYEHNPSRRGI
jgi:hypothetical protein